MLWLEIDKIYEIPQQTEIKATKSEKQVP